ncbi:hypothetical protein KFU94_60215 [Chloroflexi bacterium TSY]|nr:hypothetical protein [Chloroflexi bacterium TSY]
MSVVLVCYLLAIIAAVNGVQPRNYKRYRHNLTEMRRKLERVVEFKSYWVRVSGVIFVLASVALVLLVGVLLWWG